MGGIKEAKKGEGCVKTLSFKPKGSSSGGSDWDDGVYCNIKTLEIQFGGRCIDAIRFQYEDKYGNSVTPQKHGGNEGKRIIQVILPFPSSSSSSSFLHLFNKAWFISLKMQVRLNCPDEYLISIHGYHGDIYDRFGNPTHVIRSLTFETNEQSLGPYGIEERIKFSFPTTGLIKIVGFHGRSGWFLDAIGFHYLPISISKWICIHTLFYIYIFFLVFVSIQVSDVYQNIFRNFLKLAL